MTRVLHLSDSHVAAGGIDGDGVDALAALERLLADLRHLDGLDAVVVSGDIADDGSVAGCEAVRERVGAYAASRVIPHVYCPGNHDSRANFRRVFGSGHLGPDGADRGEVHDSAAPAQAAVSDLGGTRIVTLDTVVAGETLGRLGGDQLDWLADLLRVPTAGGTLLVGHHPPLAVPALPYVAAVALQDPQELAAVVRGSDVRVVLCGHLHLQVSGTAGGVPVCVAPGVVTRIDATTRPGLVRGVLGAGAMVVDVGSTGGVTSYAVAASDPRAGEQVYLYDPLTGEDAVD